MILPPAVNQCERKWDSPGNLNYPSFSVVFEPNTDMVTYKRTVKNVGSSVDAVYEVKVNAGEASLCSVQEIRHYPMILHSLEVARVGLALVHKVLDQLSGVMEATELGVPLL